MAAPQGLALDKTQQVAVAVLYSALAVVLGVLAIIYMLYADRVAAAARAQQEVQERDYKVRLLQLQRARFGLPIGWSRGGSTV